MRSLFDKLPQLEEMMGERGVEVDHSTLNRWILKYLRLLEEEFAPHKRPVGNRVRDWTGPT
jgi:putative transposase